VDKVLDLVLGFDTIKKLRCCCKWKFLRKFLVARQRLTTPLNSNLLGDFCF